MKLSIIICTYNREKELKRALTSVMGQQVNFEMEVVVGNDCSSDGTDALLESFQEKYPGLLIVNTLEKNSGVGTNWAKAVMLARGEYLAFLDDDDYWTDENRMQIMVDYLEKHKEINLLFTNAFIEFENGKKKIIKYPDNYPDIHEMWKGKQGNISLNVMVVRKSLIENCIRLDDYVMDMPTCVFSYTPTSLSRPKTYEEVVEKYKLEASMTKYLADCFPDDPLISFSEAESNRYINHILTNLAYRRGDYLKAKQYSMLAGENAFRDKCTRSWVMFHLYRIAKLIKGKFNKLF